MAEVRYGPASQDAPSGEVSERRRFASWIRHGRDVLSLDLAIGVAGLLVAPSAAADNTRLNDSVVANVYTVQHQAGCTNDVKLSPALALAAQWHTYDLMTHRGLDADIGSDGSTPEDRAAAAGFRGGVAETVAINPALAISSLELMKRWYDDPDDLAIMRTCSYSLMGVWSENSFDRTVVVAVYGAPA